MKVYLLHPATLGHRVITESPNSILMFSRYAPVGTLYEFDHNADDLMEWLDDLDRSIQALNEEETKNIPSRSGGDVAETVRGESPPHARASVPTAVAGKEI